MKAYRQGEIYFIPVKVSNAVREARMAGRVHKGNVIREGETSGHKHEIVGNATLLDTPTNVVTYQLNNAVEKVELPEGEMFLTADNKIKVVHPEHKTLNLPKGDYVVRIQREYDEKNGYRQVAD